MSTKERNSKVEPPPWWLAKAIPLLNSPAVKHADVARAASVHAGRCSPWTPSAISRFKEGVGRTVALTNGISAALQIPQPFFVAPTEFAASEMMAIVQRERAKMSGSTLEHAQLEARRQALSVTDGLADDEIRTGLVDGVQRRGVVSSDNGDKRGRGVWARRARRGRS